MKAKRDREEPCCICNHYHDVRMPAPRACIAVALCASPGAPTPMPRALVALPCRSWKAGSHARSVGTS